MFTLHSCPLPHLCLPLPIIYRPMPYYIPFLPTYPTFPLPILPAHLHPCWCSLLLPSPGNALWEGREEGAWQWATTCHACLGRYLSGGGRRNTLPVFCGGEEFLHTLFFSNLRCLHSTHLLGKVHPLSAFDFGEEDGRWKGGKEDTYIYLFCLHCLFF